MIAAEVTPTQIGESRRTRYPYKLVAADIAEWALKQERGTALPGKHLAPAASSSPGAWLSSTAKKRSG
jgi:hypothetical protein